ncbi:DUF6924 domain-containing protein [Actinacidiphila glaucinigra]|uniref:DUF6924 domain-containing protein n=1 Tax=Actinacidiphila glaucinigra TaxID=235986 RepID=UPI0035DE5668
MRSFSRADERRDFEAVIIRTDYRDERAWRLVKNALSKSPLGIIEKCPPNAWIVDDPEWSGASVDEVLDVVDSSDALKGLQVLFMADGVAMQAAHHALMVVTTESQDESYGEEICEETMKFGRVFRTLPEEVHSIHVDLELANMGFDDFAAAAHDDPQDIYRS